MKITTKELIIIKELQYCKRRYTRVLNITIAKSAQIRDFRLKLMKIRNQIDYMLLHPRSVDNSNKTRLHKRDKYFNKRKI